MTKFKILQIHMLNVPRTPAGLCCWVCVRLITTRAVHHLWMTSHPPTLSKLSKATPLNFYPKIPSAQLPGWWRPFGTIFVILPVTPRRVWRESQKQLAALWMWISPFLTETVSSCTEQKESGRKSNTRMTEFSKSNSLSFTSKYKKGTV